jgi:hypothetical protein
MTDSMAKNLVGHDSLNGGDNNETGHHRHYDDIEEPTYHKPTWKEFAGCCSGKCCGTFSAILGLCIASGIAAVIVGDMLGGGTGGALIGWLIGAGIPFVLTSIFASEIFGGSSVDKGQVFLAFSLHAVLMIFVLLLIVLPYIRNPAMVLFYPLDEHNLRCRVNWYDSLGALGFKEIPNPMEEMNITKAQLKLQYTPEDLNTPCYGMGFALGLGGAVPEEILKFVTIGAFISRGWVADPWAVVVYCFVIGSTFGFIENLSYVATIFTGDTPVSVRMFLIGYGRVFQAQTLIHATCAILTGLLFAQRKFLFWRQYGELKTCCEFAGPRPFYLIMFPAVWIHFLNNFLAGSLPQNPLLSFLWVIIMFSNLVIAPLWSYYLFLTLKNVPRVNIIDLQKSGQVPKALSYICCCGCCRQNEMGQRDRRYESVLNMVDMKALDQQVGEQYLPPIITEA